MFGHTPLGVSYLACVHVVGKLDVFYEAGKYSGYKRKSPFGVCTWVMLVYMY